MHAVSLQVPPQMTEKLLTVDNLSVRYPSRRFFAAKSEPAIEDISFSLQAGHILGIVGESGSGKTTLIRALLRLIPPATGKVTFNTENWLALKGKALARARRRIGVVSQNPFLSLSPRMNIAQILTEPLHAGGQTRPDKVVLESALNAVGLPVGFLPRKAASLSGGQAQRVAIARALMLKPDLLILDEATSALDVSVQAQILNLLMEIRYRTNVSMVFVSHDLAVVQHLSDDLMVMRRGKIIEHGPTEQIISNPSQPYTRALLNTKKTSGNLGGTTGIAGDPH